MPSDTLTIAAAAGLLLAFLSVWKSRARVEAQKSDAADRDRFLRREVMRDALPAPDVSELLRLLGRYRLRLYMVPGCQACLLQKLLLSNYMEDLDVVNCAKQPDVCNAAGIQGVPAWAFPEGFPVRQRVGILSKRDLLALLRRRASEEADFFRSPK